MLWIFIKARTNLFDGNHKTILHIAPEPCFRQHLQKAAGVTYITADLFDPAVQVAMNVMDIPFADGAFDVIICNHVLEHVLDDQRAMRELHRVLKHDGWAILLVPVIGEKTHEDPSKITWKERLKAFGQEDHVRKYGRDYVDRLRASGFKVTIIGVGDVVDKDNVTRVGLAEARGDIYYCTK